MVVGIIALWDIRQSKGTKGGSAWAVLGVSIGGVVSLLWAAFALMIIVAGARSSSGPSTPLPPPPPTAWTPPGPMHPRPGPTIPSPGPTGTSEKMTWNLQNTEVTIDRVTVVDVGASVPTLEAELRRQQGNAAAHSQKLILHTSSMTCRPCLGFSTALSDPLMQKALKDVRLVRVDVNLFAEELAELGVPSDVVPGFFMLGRDMRPADGISGGEWDDDHAGNIAPIMEQFVNGSLKKRRHRWHAPSSVAPPATIL